MSRATIRRARRATTICFQRSFRRFLKIWPLQTKIGELQIDSDDFAHWDIEAAGPNWQVSTRYDFLRQEQMIRANMAEPMWRQVPRALLLDARLSRAPARCSACSAPHGSTAWR